MKNFLLIILCLLFTSGTAMAKDQITVKNLIQGNTSWDGSSFNYPTGTPEIAVVKISIPKGFNIPLHCHSVPLAAYITKGKLEVIKKSGQKEVFAQGEAMIEVSNIWHKGLGLAQNTELVVFYAGSKQYPLSLKEDDKSKFAKKCK